MLALNRTLMMTVICLVAMLLTGLAPNVQASTILSDHQNSQIQSKVLQKQLGVNTDCIDLPDNERTLTSGKDQHTSCSSSCIVKVPVNLPQNGLILLPYRLALIDRSPSVKAVTIVYEPYRPPIV